MRQILCSTLRVADASHADNAILILSVGKDVAINRKRASYRNPAMKNKRD